MKNILVVLLTGLIFTLPLQAKVRTVPFSELVPDKRHERATEIIIHIIKSYHYKKTQLNDELSDKIYARYLENLDPNHSFFTQKDIDQFNKYQYEMDDSLRKSKLEPAFEIFRTYRRIVEDRIDFALDLLEDEFDFSLDETYRFDRREMTWADNKSLLNEIWRKRIKNDFLNLQLAEKEPDEIRDTLSKRYHSLKTSTQQLKADDIFQTFINAYTMTIEPHTSYFSPRTSENFDISMRLSLEGIGAVLTSQYEYTMVQRVVPGGAADLAEELHANDRITGVGQDNDGEIVDVIGWRLDDVVDLIRGPKGTVVRLEVLPEDTGTEGPSKVISITRDKIKLEEQAAQSSILELPNNRGRVGVIDVPTFYSDFAAQAKGEKDYKSTSRDVRKILKDLAAENIDGIIVDLRSNGGGSLSEALELTGLFIESGPIVQTKDSSGRIEINNDPDPSISYSGPLAVLVDRNSASASEIFAGAIQDYRRGIIVGEPTFGKGTVQNIVDLNRFIRRADEDHGKLKTTIAQFFRISGGSNQHKGVIPDIVYPTAKHNDDHGERSLENALPWDKVEPARYIAASAPIDNFTEVTRVHEQRIKSDKLFQVLLDQLDLAYEASSKKEVSLLSSTRKKEREEYKETRRLLENEFRIAQGLKPIEEDDDEDTEAEGENTNDADEFKPKDVLLEETANIIIDLIIPSRTTAATSQK